MDIKKPRLLGIDFLRFVCASLVFTAHFISNVDEINNLYWKNLIHNTKYATEIFFVISGFVIAKISSEAKYSELIFILKRFYRIFIIGYIIIFLLNPNFFLSKIVDCYNFNNYLNIFKKSMRIAGKLKNKKSINKKIKKKKKYLTRRQLRKT